MVEKKRKSEKKERNALYITVVIHSAFGCKETMISPHHLVVCVCVCVCVCVYRHTHIILSLNILFHIIFFIQFDIHSFDYFFLSLILFSMLSLNILFYFIFVSDFGSYSFNF